MINLYVKFNVHNSYTKQVIELNVADRRTDAPGDDNMHPPKRRVWVVPTNHISRFHNYMLVNIISNRVQ